MNDPKHDAAWHGTEPDLSGHIPCQEAGQHVCQEPSGRSCAEGCDQPAGTLWGPYWCPDHDSQRLARISAQMENLFGEVTR